MPNLARQPRLFMHVFLRPEQKAALISISRILKTPDSRPIHKLLRSRRHKSRTAIRGILQAYFLDGLDISDTDVQEELVSKAGLDFTVLAAQDEEAESQLAEDLDEGRMAGIEGVPLMIFAGRYSVAGAYPPDVLVSAIDACAP